MPRVNHSEIICILDCSGSMRGNSEESILGFNLFLDDQKKEEGTADISVYLFNTESKLVVDRVNIENLPYLNDNIYRPEGGTALLDTLGRAIDETGQRLASTREENRPENILVCVLTDGLENSSRSYSRRDVLQKIQHQTEVYNWKFIYLAANQDVFCEAEKLGISKDYASGFESTKSGTSKGYDKFSKIVGSARKGIKLPDWD